MTTLGKTLAAAVALTLMAAPAEAQRLNNGATGTFGQVRLTSGFEPDPHNVTLNAGGAYDASQLGDNCSGYIATRPSFSLRYRAGELPLYIGAVANGDTTLVVRAPNGSWSCDDDSGGNLNPLVSWESPASGRYQIWVGRFGVQNETTPAVLHISEVGGPEAQTTSGQQLDFTLEPTYGSVDLVSGFQPDPHTQAISAGGAVDASTLGVAGCVGWVAQAPDYRVNWTAGSGALLLVFSVQAEADTTLVINDAQGNWVCDDDGGNNGLNPAITFTNPASGQYDIWVGTFSQGDLQPSALNVSELYAQ
jgi:hypothetical protein